MDRLINRRQQGDLGEASAIEWLTSQGATVSMPLGHSPDYDLIAEVEGRLWRVQVKTSVVVQRRSAGACRYPVHIATKGGNQSWSGVAKRFDSSRFDLLFVLVADGRRWLIPSAYIEAETSIRLGGPKYSEFEVSGGQPIYDLVYGSGDSVLQSAEARGSVGVWRAERDCKFRAEVLSEFESHLPHQPPSPDRPPRLKPSK